MPGPPRDPLLATAPTAADSASAPKLGSFAYTSGRSHTTTPPKERLAAAQDLNAQLSIELLLVQAEHEQLLDEERRGEPVEPSTSEHLALGWNHLLEWFSRSMTGCGQLVCRRCCQGSAVESGSRDCRIRPAGSGTPKARRNDLKPHFDPQSPSVLGEDGVREAHLGRWLKRSTTIKLNGYNQMTATSPTKGGRATEARPPSPSRSPGSSRGAGVGSSSEDLSMVYIAEDKPEAVGAAGLWCPSHPSKQIWDLGMLALIVFSCITIPFRIGLDAPAQGLAAQVEVAITLLFITDLCCNFNTAYLEGQHFVIHRGMIARNYLSGWFWIDLASSFPFEWAEAAMTHFMECCMQDSDETSHSTMLKLLRALRMFRLLRLLRLLKLQHYIDAVEDKLQINLQVLQIVKMVLGLIYLMHLLGCFWFFTATQSGYESTWLSNYDGGSGLTAPKDVQYLYSIYWALMTLTTVGYGDITPANNTERLYALASLLIGALVFGYMLSSIGDLIGSLDKGGARLQDRLDEVKEFTRWHKMTPDLATRVRKYYEFYYSRQSALDEEEMLKIMAPSLHRDVMTHLLSRSVEKIPFFFVPMLGSQPTDQGSQPADVNFQLAVYPLLRPVVRESKEDVVKKGEFSQELYFLHRGSVAATADWTDEDMEPRQLFQLDDPGCSISEHVLTEGPADVSYRAVSRCEFFCLAKEELLALFERFPHAPAEIAHFVQEDVVEHKKKRYWSLRLAARGGPKTPPPDAEDDGGAFAEQAMLEHGALRLQVGWLKSRLQKVAATEKERLFPCLFGASRMRTIERAKPGFLKRGGTKMVIEAFPEATVAVGVVPFGGAFLPKITSPRASSYPAAPSGVDTGGASASSSTSLSHAGRSGGDRAPAAVESLVASFAAVESRMAAREAQLAGVTAGLKRLLEQRGAAGAVPGESQ